MPNFINIVFPMRRGAQGAFAANEETLRAVSDDLRILLLTNYGERPIHYDFGANLRRILFEQGEDVKQQINDSIVAAVDKWMPFLVIDQITIKDNKDDSTLRLNEVRIDIDFRVGNLEGSLSQQIRG